MLDIYSNETDSKYYKIFEKNKNVRFNGSIPYSQVQKEILSSDIVVIVEGFKQSEVRITMYSLSTKVADSLASGSNILVYGSIECGAIEYMQSIDSAAVCLRQDDLVECISHLIEDTEYQRRNYDNAEIITQQRHNIMQSSAIFEGVVNKVIEEREENHA
jgi:hypothetical protein